MAFTVIPNHLKIKSIKNSSVSVLLLHLVTESTMVSYLSQSILSSCVGVKKILTPLLWKQLLGRICPQNNIASQLSDLKSRGEVKLAQGLTQASGIRVVKLDKFLSCWTAEMLG